MSLPSFKLSKDCSSLSSIVVLVYWSQETWKWFQLYLMIQKRYREVKEGRGRTHRSIARVIFICIIKLTLQPYHSVTVWLTSKQCQCKCIKEYHWSSAQIPTLTPLCNVSFHLPKLVKFPYVDEIWSANHQKYFNL